MIQLSRRLLLLLLLLRRDSRDIAVIAVIAVIAATMTAAAAAAAAAMKVGGTAAAGRHIMDTLSTLYRPIIGSEPMMRHRQAHYRHIIGAL